MWLLKSALRLMALIGLITLIPFAIWWVFTGLGWWDTIEEIEYLGS